MTLDPNNTDRSYLFGRLMAVAEVAERSTYQRDEGREPNAVRMQAVFSQRPRYAWRIVQESLGPYLAKMNPGLRTYYKTLIDEILGKMPTNDDYELNKRLEDSYIMGMSHQRVALYQKKNKDAVIEEDNENEYAEKQD